jgi:lipoprotein-releasing system permease protein
LFNKAERIIALRNLRPKRKEGFLKVISIFSFLGIMLGVAVLIIVMSVMNGFRTDLTNKILGLNPHITAKPYQVSKGENFKLLLKKKYKDFKISESLTGEGIAINKENTKGVLIKGVNIKENNNIKFLQEKILDGDFKNFKNGKIILGNELALTLEVSVGDSISLMSSTFIGTPIGKIPKQETYKVSAIFNSGFYEFDQNVIFLNISDAMGFFEKTKEDLSLEIYLDKPIKADLYKKEIEKLSENYYLYSWTDLNRSFFGALKVERNVMFIILTLIIIVAAFNIISGLTILIKNKTKEIAILKTLGLSNSSITKSFFLTGFTIGFLASIAGVFLGVIFSFYIEEIRYFISTIFGLEIFPADIYILDKMPSEINFFSTLFIFLFSILITSIASFFPAKAAATMNPVKALKYE